MLWISAYFAIAFLFWLVISWQMARKIDDVFELMVGLMLAIFPAVTWPLFIMATMLYRINHGKVAV